MDQENKICAHIKHETKYKENKFILETYKMINDSQIIAQMIKHMIFLISGPQP